MLRNVFGRLIARRVASDTDVVRILVNPNIIEPHDARHIVSDRVIDGREVVGHAQVHDDGHRLKRNHALTNITIRANSSSIQGPGFVGPDKPGDVSFSAGGIFKGIDLVLGAVVPLIVQISETGHGLLIGTSSITVDLRYVTIIYSREFYSL